MILKTGCLLACYLLIASVEASVPQVKVLIAKSLAEVNVEGIDLRKTLYHGQKSQQYQGRKNLKFKCHAHNLKTTQLLASVSSPTGLISWGESKYQGELQLINSPTSSDCHLVNKIPMDSYISSLLAKEMNGTWPIEALKAQAVAARTYAYQKIKTKVFYHLESSEKDQVSGNFFDITEKTLMATKGTEGEILIGPTGKVTPAFFHSKCGGKTYRPDQVWGGVEEGYQQVECPFCHKTGMKPWRHVVSKSKLTDMLDRVLTRYYADSIKNKNELRVMDDDVNKTDLRFYAGSKLHIVKKAYLRHLFGRELLPSNNYSLSKKQQGFEVAGQGYGHGVGMCQLGALELAKRGYTYKEILSHYYPKHRLKKIY